MNAKRFQVLGLIVGAALALAVAPPGATAAPKPTKTPHPTPTPTPIPTPTPTPRYEFSVDSGKANSVGVVPNPGQDGDSTVKLSGGFAFGGSVDLTAATLTVRSVLDEVGGAGELVKGFQGADLLPLTLVLKASTATSATWVRPTSDRPNVQMTVVRKAPGLFLATLRVTRASLPDEPQLCSGVPATTFLDTVFVIDDGTELPVTVAGSTEWVCEIAKQSLRVALPGPTATPLPTSTPTATPGATASPSPTATASGPTPTPVGPTPTPGVPTPTPTQVVSNALKASIRIDLLTRQTGQPSKVLLDGSNSSDQGGTILIYTFSVARTSDGSLVYGPNSTSAAQVTTTINPGDYNAILTVRDDHGAVSAPDTRGFSIK